MAEKNLNTDPGVKVEVANPGEKKTVELVIKTRSRKKRVFSVGPLAVSVINLTLEKPEDPSEKK